MGARVSDGVRSGGGYDTPLRRRVVVDRVRRPSEASPDVSLAKCRVCGRDVLSRAITCPNCGAPRPWEPAAPAGRAAGRGYGTVVVVGGLVALGLWALARWNAGGVSAPALPEFTIGGSYRVQAGGTTGCTTRAEVERATAPGRAGDETAVGRGDAEPGCRLVPGGVALTLDTTDAAGLFARVRLAGEGTAVWLPASAIE